MIIIIYSSTLIGTPNILIIIPTGCLVSKKSAKPYKLHKCLSMETAENGIKIIKVFLKQNLKIKYNILYCFSSE